MNSKPGANRGAESEMSTEGISAMLQFTKEFEWKYLKVKTSLKFGKMTKLPCFLNILVLVAKYIE